MHIHWFLGACLLACPSLAQAQYRLATQDVKGAERVCVYAPLLGRDDSARRQSFKVGRGEPCPRTPPRPSSFKPQQAIPPMARLAGERQINEGIVCSYEYLGRQYEHTLAAGRSCPETAYFP